jgi:hypothetical protein
VPSEIRQMSASDAPQGKAIVNPESVTVFRRATTTQSSFTTCTVFGRTISEGSSDANSAGRGSAAEVHHPGGAQPGSADRSRAGYDRGVDPGDAVDESRRFVVPAMLSPRPLVGITRAGNPPAKTARASRSAIEAKGSGDSSSFRSICPPAQAGTNDGTAGPGRNEIPLKGICFEAS